MAYNLQSLITILQQILNPEQTRWIIDHNKPQLEFLITIFQRILNPKQTRWLPDHNKPQLESLLEKVASLTQILENSSVPLESLESRIRDAAHKAEDIIESHMVYQVLSRPGGVSFTFCTPDLQQVMEEIDSAMEQVAKFMDGRKMSTGSSSTGAAFLPDPTSENVVVGLEEDLLRLKDRLTAMQNKLEIVPIVGMGGIGKTKLAQKLYDDPLMVSHFEVRAWTTISQDYNVRAILLGLLCRPNEKLSDELIERKDNELKDILYKRLYGRRYMIVLDDIWSTECWDGIRRYFPDNNNGSRIVLTTRESDVAKYADSQSLQHQVQLLNKSESWNLLHQIVFGEEDCPDDALEGIGRKIARDCGGLPLAINVIGGLLSKTERSKDVWEHIANDVSIAIAETGQQFFSILSLSYNHLPNHLKPCFLYMGAFPEDYEIMGSRLIRMWVAEGFLKSNGGKSLEEEAEDYLKALVERNLLLVTEYKSNGKPGKYSVHDLLRDLCMRKADEEKLLHVMNGRVQKVTLCNLRRVSVHTSYHREDVYASAELMSLARSFICTGLMSHEIISPIVFVLRMLRVLDVMEMKFPEFPREIYQLVNLRYLALSWNSGNIPSGISRLWNLQTFIARSKASDFDVPSEVWEMSELRHLKLNTLLCIEEGHRIKFVHKNLQTITYVIITAALISWGFFESIPNIKNLSIFVHILPSSSVDLSHLLKLETLTCHSTLKKDGCRFLPTLRFPCNLRKLNLYECVIFGRVLTTLCALPNLEVFKIRKCVFESETADEEWEAAAGDEFRSLQFLELVMLKLVRWRADETNFPRLRRLLLRRCSALEEIPSGIGEIPTLQLIDVYECSPSAAASAKQIQEVQQSVFDNYDLQFRIR